MEEQVDGVEAAAAAAPVAAAATAANVIPKTPLKAEVIFHGSPDNEASERSDGAASPPPNCSICLGKLINKSFTDSCLHQFCFSCLLQWSKIKTECPLCKQTFKSIIHNVRSEEDYDQYHVPRQFAPLSAQQMAATLDINFDVFGLNLDVEGRRFSYRTTMTPNRRYGVFLNPEQVARREQVPALRSLVSREERRLRRTNPVDYRRNVYRFGIWATSLPDIFGNFRECNAEYYRREPNQLNRLIPWLNRELQVLLNNNAPHVAYVMRIIMESLTLYDLRSPEFRNVVRPYFGIHAEHFVHELLNYARTSFDLIGYDQYVTYVPTHGLSNEYVPLVTSPSSSGSSTSNDSDVQVVDETIERSRLNVEMPRVGPHTVEMPGPSTVAEAFHEQMPSSRIVLTISSSSSGVSDNECEVVGYVKPRHERTPEIIDLLSSDGETVNVTNTTNLDYGDHTRNNYQPPTRQYTTYEDSVDRSLIDSPSVPTSSEVYEPGTSTDRKRSTIRNNTRLAIKSHVSDTTTSESDDCDSDRDYTPRGGSSKPKTKLKRSSGTASIRQQKHKQRTSMFTRMRQRLKVAISSSSESDEKSKLRSYEPTPISPESDSRRYSSTWSDSSPDRRNKRLKTKGKSKSMQSEVANTIKVRKDLIKREEYYSQDCAESDGSQLSAAVSEHRSFSGKKYDSRRYHGNKDSDSEKETRRQESEDNEASNKKHTDGKYKAIEYSTTDSERNLTNARSSSQCSVRSSKAHVNKKKSKHKDKRREKRSRTSNSKSIINTATDSFQAEDCAPSISTASVTSSVRSETPVPSKYSNSKKRSSSKDRRRSHKKHKESKKSRKRSKSESKSRSKKRKRRIKSSSSSDSERETASKLC